MDRQGYSRPGLLEERRRYGSFDGVTWHGTISGTQPVVPASGQGDVVAWG